MERDKAITAFLNGEKILIGDYRGGKAETIRYRDKLTRATMEMRVVRHNVEFGNESFVVTEEVPDDFKVENFKPTFPKGTAVVILWKSATVEKGITTLRANTITQLEAKAK